MLTMAYWLGNNLFGQTGWIKRFKQARKKPKERKFEEKKMQAKLEQKGMAIVGAPMKEKTENQPPFDCLNWTWTMDLFVIIWSKCLFIYFYLYIFMQFLLI